MRTYTYVTTIIIKYVVNKYMNHKYIFKKLGLNQLNNIFRLSTIFKEIVV